MEEIRYPGTQEISITIMRGSNVVIYTRKVRQIIHPALFETYMNLNSITQDDVDKAETFPQLLPTLNKFIEKATNEEGTDYSPPIVATWGRWNIGKLLSWTCKIYRLQVPTSGNMCGE